MTAASGKAEGGTGVPDGIDLDAQIIHARGIYEGDCETFGKQSQWAIKSGSILASLFELKDARGKSCGVVSEEMITAYLNAQAKSVHEAESNFQLIRPRKHCAEGLRAALSFTPAANGPGEAGWLPIESAPKDGTMILLGRAAEGDESVAVSTAGFWQEGWPDGVDDMGCDDGFVDIHYCDFSPPRSFGAESYRSAGRQPTHWQPLPAAPGSASTPQPGMVTVPREPTKDMLEEGFDAINKQYARDPLDDALERTQAVYRAMLDAALRSGEKGTP